MANAWLTLVKKTWDEGRKTNEDYSYKQAMMDAKMKKNGSKKHGSKKGGQADEDEDVEEEMTPSGETMVEDESTMSTSTPTMGGKSRRSKKSKKSKKGGKTSKKSKKAGKKSKKTRKSRK
jgi:hypothetical protein